jgi:hypothetical protein
MDQRRRIALRNLQTHQTVTLADLAELVTECEMEKNVLHLPPDEVKDVYFSLYHIHVPILEDADLAWYDQQDDLVGTTEQTNPALSTARDTIDTLIQ